jgi:ABC-type multidrug transport system ATPase subunit
MQLTISNLSKTYPNGVAALNDVSLTIPNGMFGLLGPNGAGKSTLMRTIATLQDTDSGSIMLDGLNVLKEKMAVRKILKGITSGRNELVNALLHKTNLWDVRRKSLSGFSGGMKQRFGIAQALLGDPKLIIVDEPTAGLDPGERNRFYNLLSEIGEDRIVILSTHIVDDVKELCSNMAIIDKGRVLFAGAPNDALNHLHGKIWSKQISKQELDEAVNRYRVISTRMVGGRPLIHVFSDVDPGDGFSSSIADLEDVFFSKIIGLN